MIELIYRQWYCARPALAQAYLRQLLEGPGDPIALFAPRRIGKTSFLLTELSTLARRRGLLPVYVDVWQNRADVPSAINYALQEAIDDLQVPSTTVGRRLKTTVRKVGFGGAALEFGDEPARHPPEEPPLRIDWLLRTLIRTARRPILLLFDEVQELAVAPSGETVVSALRSAITKSRDSVRVVFTGSSQEQLIELISRSRAALYEGASLVAFPPLGTEFIDFVAKRVKARFRRSIDIEELAAAFERLHHQPRALLDLVFLHASSDSGTLSALLNAQWEALLEGASFERTWANLKQLHQRLCQRIVRGLEVSSAEARRDYASGTGQREVSPGTVHSALRALLKSHVLARAGHGRGAYQIDDPLFAEWIRRMHQGER